MKLYQLGELALLLGLLPVSLAAQVASQTSSHPVLAPAAPQNAPVEQERQDNKDNSRLPSGRYQRTGASGRFFTPFKQKRNKEQQQRLLPDPADVTKYSAFLAQPGTGLARIMNDIDCNTNAYILRADEECLDAVPDGSFFSFRKREHTSPVLADLRLREGLLVSDGALSQNVLVYLGKTPLETVSLNSPGIDFLTNFVPEEESRGATRQYIQITKGIRSGRYEYLKAIPSALAATYALRLVAYRGKIYRRYQGWIYNLLEGDNRADLLVAFRIVNKDKDSVTILWKELEKKQSPKIKISKPLKDKDQKS